MISRKRLALKVLTSASFLGIESYYCDRERRNQLMHGEWHVSLLMAPGVPRTRLSPKKDTAVTWGASTPDDVWRLAWRFLAYKRLFSYHRHATESLARRNPMYRRMTDPGIRPLILKRANASRFIRRMER
jgi:hypothetical protein